MLLNSNIAKPYSRWGFIITLIVVMICSPGPYSLAKSKVNKNSQLLTVKAVIPRNFPPQYSTNAMGQPTGFAIEVMEKIAARAGLEVTYELKESWAEAIEALREGEADLIPNLGIIPERKADFFFTSSLETSPVVVFVRQATYQIGGVEDLPGKSVVVVQENAAFYRLQNQNINLKIVNTPEEALFKLLSGEVDALVYPEPALQRIAHTIQVDRRIKSVGKPLVEISRAIAVGKENKALLIRLEPAVVSFLASGDYQRAYLKWYRQHHAHWLYDQIIGVLGVLLLLSILWRFWMSNHLSRLQQAKIDLEKANSKLKREIKQRRQTEEQLELFFYQSLDGFFFMMLDEPIEWDETIEREKTLDYVFDHQKVTKANQAILDQYGATKTEFLGRTPRDFFVHDSAAGRALWQEFFDRGRVQVETNECKLDGTPMWIEGDYICLYDAQGRITGHFGIQRDITERKAAEKALRRSQEELRLITDSVPGGVVYVDAEQRYRFVNRIYEVWVDLPRKEILGKYIWEIIGEDAYQVIQEYIEQVLAGENVSFETQLNLKTGREFYVSATLVPARGEDEKDEQIYGYYALITDISDRKQAETQLQQLNQNLENLVAARTEQLQATLAQLQENEQKLHQMTSLVPGMVFQFHITPNGQYFFDFVSDGVMELYELSPETVSKDVGRIFALVKPEQLEPLIAAIEASRRELTEFSYDYEVITPSSQEKWLRCHSLPQKIDDGTVIWNGIVMDITRDKQREKELKQAKEAADAANQAKSEFLANISHELRTPLNAILGFGHLLKNQIIEPRPLTYIESISSSGNTLLALINDILDLAKIEAGKLVMHYESVNLRHLVTEIKQIFLVQAKRKNLLLLLDIDPQVPEAMYFDQMRLRQILFNLVGNAIKFTEEGSVKVTVSCLKAPEKQRSEKIPLQIVVSDTGIGIAPEEQQKIFEAFEQSSRSDVNQYGGTGLGLTITQRLTQMLGGRIELESQFGRGSNFTLIFPEVALAALPEKIDSLDSVGNLAQFPPLTVLVVDDIASNRELIQEYFQDTQHHLLFAANGQQALDLSRNYQPDVIFLDLRMPGMDGKEVARRLQQDEITQNIPIIIITASAFQEQKAELLGLYQGFLTKPVSLEQIILELAKIFPQQCSNEYIYITNSQVNLPNYPLNNYTNSSSERHIDWEQELAQLPPLTILVVDDVAANRELIGEYFAGSQHQIISASDGQEGLDIAASYHPDVILLDAKLPKMDGQEVARLLKQNPATADIPIIVVTAFVNSEAQQLFPSSVQSFLSKPISLKALISEFKFIFN